MSYYYCDHFNETHYHECRAIFETLLRVKISTEKYMKKLRHQGE